MATEGTFLLADIGGYTSFLSDVGIRHGKEITEHLLNRLVRTMPKRWKVGNVMGDCVFFYTPERASADQTFDSVRSLYHAFRDAKTDVADGSTCRCGACDRTEDLSLKFVVHAGEFDVQNIGGRKELIGQEIVLATRLLKNSVPVREYAIVTPAAPGFAEAAGISSVAVQDEVEAMGTVDYAYVDLQSISEAYERERQVYITEDESNLIVTAEIDAPPDEVFRTMFELDKRAYWQLSIEHMEHIQGEPGAIGEVHTCLHEGNIKIVHLTVALDWEGRRVTERVWVSPPIMKDTYITMSAEPIEGGRTRAALLAQFKPRYPVLSHLAWPYFVFAMKRSIRKDMAGLKELCETGHIAAREKVAAKSDA